MTLVWALIRVLLDLACLGMIIALAIFLHRQEKGD